MFDRKVITPLLSIVKGKGEARMAQVLSRAMRPGALVIKPGIIQNPPPRAEVASKRLLFLTYSGLRPKKAPSWTQQFSEIICMRDLRELHDAIIRGDPKTTHTVTEQALAEGIDPLKLVNEHMIPAMDEVGRRFECSEYFVPELLISARAMKAALELIRPLLIARGEKPVGRVAIGTVKGDLHDIGKNLVASLLEGGGFEVIDLGVNVSPERFIASVKEKNANIIAMSALLTTTMPAMKTTIEALKQAGLRDQVKVLIGGAPITQRYAEEIGADGYSENAVGAVALAKKAWSLAA